MSKKIRHCTPRGIDERFVGSVPCLESPRSDGEAAKCCPGEKRVSDPPIGTLGDRRINEGRRR
jgi:hypothetical protein